MENLSDALARSAAEHRTIEIWLDRFLAAAHGERWPELSESFARVMDLAAAHFSREERSLFAALEPDLAAFTSKLRAQHEETREIGAHLAELLATGGPPDELRRLALRFHAITQHNIIEEERDLFPLAARL